MYKLVIKHTRPNTQVDFFYPRTSPLVIEECKQHINEQYIMTGKLVDSETSTSADGLEILYTTIWESESVYNEWNADSVIADGLLAVGSAYRDTNGIVSEVVSTETI